MVITVDKNRKPLGVTSEKRARKLIEKGRACVQNYYPFVLVIKDIDARQIENLPEYQIKIDPGGVHTGLAIVRTDTNEFVYGLQLDHRSGEITEALKTRSGARRNRRSRETRYRRPKWGNNQKAKNSSAAFDSGRGEDWLPPSVKSAADNIVSWVRRLQKYMNITSCTFEAVRFDTQGMDDPAIQGQQYQQGSLFGYELREYLLDHYGHVCQYCGGVSGDAILERDHIVPKSKGGSDKLTNATIACHTCNQDKGSKTLSAWKAEEKAIAEGKVKKSKKRTELAKARVKGITNVKNGNRTGISNRYCAWVNSSRRYVEKKLFAIFGTVECSSGGRTKYNRIRLGYPKDHQYDALCVGSVPQGGYIDRTHGWFLRATATGRGSRLRHVKRTKCGILIKPKQNSKHLPKLRFGFVSGDIVKVTNPKGKYKGTFIGRVTTRMTGYFTVRTMDGGKIETKAANCRLLQHDCGYRFSFGKTG